MFLRELGMSYDWISTLKSLCYDSHLKKIHMYDFSSSTCFFSLKKKKKSHTSLGHDFIGNSDMPTEIDKVLHAFTFILFIYSHVVFHMT